MKPQGGGGTVKCLAAVGSRNALVWHSKRVFKSAADTCMISQENIPHGRHFGLYNRGGKKTSNSPSHICPHHQYDDS